MNWVSVGIVCILAKYEAIYVPVWSLLWYKHSRTATVPHEELVWSPNPHFHCSIKYVEFSYNQTNHNDDDCMFIYIGTGTWHRYGILNTRFICFNQKWNWYKITCLPVLTSWRPNMLESCIIYSYMRQTIIIIKIVFVHEQKLAFPEQVWKLEFDLEMCLRLNVNFHVIIHVLKI